MLELIIIFFIFFVVPFLRKVPANTVIIIDRNGHYLKTKEHGWYILWPSDKVTTTISTRQITRTLSEYYETDDGKIVHATINCRYHTHNIADVIQALANVRRSVDDVIQSSAYFAINNYKLSDILGVYNHEFSDRVKDNLRSEFNSIGINLTSMQIYVSPTSAVGVSCFRPHESSCYRDTKNVHKHDKSLMIGDKFTNGPIIYK